MRGTLLVASETEQSSCLVDALAVANPGQGGRQRTSINKGWKFSRTESNPDGIIYDHRPDLANLENPVVLKPWILPSGNDFINDPASRHEMPSTSPPISNLSYVQTSLDDSEWESVTLPHDWAIAGPFYTEDDPIVGGGMGRLPVHGVGWYRRVLTVSEEDLDNTIYLDIDGSMSYTMVWVNGELVGGWPYGYASFRLDMTSYLKAGDNQLAIRTDNPPDSARWYPGAGLYRSVWITKAAKLHVGQWGTFITSSDVSADSATLDLVVNVENTGDSTRKVDVVTTVYEVDSKTGKAGNKKFAAFAKKSISVKNGEKISTNSSTAIKNPRLWGPPPTQEPNLYVAVTTISVGNRVLDTYETKFGIRELTFDSDEGLLVNGEHIKIQGVNEHHDLGAIGAAFNVRAAERKLAILRDLGVNGIRMAHNPPARELLELTDKLGFLVIDEIFDCWELGKTDGDFHLIFPDWHEADLRSFMRRDRNHASVIAWSFGNEVTEQHNGEEGAEVARHLYKMVMEEDSTRPATASMNYAKPDMPFGGVMDILSINYQGSGIRDTPNYSNLQGIRTDPLYPAFHEAFPEKMILGSETASTLSTRGTFLFPVTVNTGAPINETSGGNSTTKQVSAYELFTANFGSPPDKVWTYDDRSPFVAGEFVWTGFDYIGEPTPYYSTRSSYSGIVDLAGFRKDRYYLYQSRWRPDLRMAHIVPHWNWPDRVGEVTPVHVFSAADEAELFVNGESQGRIVKDEFTYRFRWDDVKYEPGQWVEESIKTTGAAAKLRMSADRTTLEATGEDLVYMTVEVVDKKGNIVPTADDLIRFSVSGPVEIIATDNGNPADMNAFGLHQREAFSGLGLVILRTKEGLEAAVVQLRVIK
ncbi:glycoside hydrolase superfamily [Dactylonectria estremocensis]|uniref:Glycoside hydrolase superfamily n=1 Tax=Dactylonectria estremocensis TaxID=1079267 RepID=A0A9P9J1M6_9HYPO|nr:glycoside hydrolase superfamily [Dactylonectria estremocensis]